MGSRMSSVLLFIFLFVTTFSPQSIYCFCDQNKSYTNLLLIKNTLQICCTNSPRMSTNKIQPGVPSRNLTAGEDPQASQHVEGPRLSRRPAPRGRASVGLVPWLQERPRARSRPHSRAPPIRSAEQASRETSLREQRASPPAVPTRRQPALSARNCSLPGRPATTRDLYFHPRTRHLRS